MRLRVTAIGAQTTISGMVALLTRAQAERPGITRAADASAGRFLVAVPAGAALVAAGCPDRPGGAVLLGAPWQGAQRARGSASSS